jgi:hypothetical protein
LLEVDRHEAWVDRLGGAAWPGRRKARGSWGLALQLSNLQKLYVSLMAVGLAIGFGRSTGAAVEHGLLSADVVEKVRLASEGGVVANLLSAPLTAVLLSKAGAPIGTALPLALRSALGGPVALVELRLAGRFEPASAGGPE